MEMIRIGLVSDIHVGSKSKSVEIRDLNAHMEERTDVSVWLGDLVHRGLESDIEYIEEALKDHKNRSFFLLGNHDHEAGQANYITQRLMAIGLEPLQPPPYPAVEPIVYQIAPGVGIVGVKGFEGGFGKRRMMNFGEPERKAWYNTAQNEADALDVALSQTDLSHILVGLHYSPIRGTLGDEDPQIYPALGNSVFESVINKHMDKIDFVVHGHAHDGSPSGTTSFGVSVLNVAQPVLRRFHSERMVHELYEFVELPIVRK